MEPTTMPITLTAVVRLSILSPFSARRASWAPIQTCRRSFGDAAAVAAANWAQCTVGMELGAPFVRLKGSGQSRIMTSSQRIHDLVPDSGPPPANEAIRTSSAGTKDRWQVTPGRTRTEDPKDAIEHATIIYTPNATRLVR